MGKDRVIQKDIGFDEAMDKVVKGLAAGTYTVAQVQQMFPGSIPVGDYKGYGALWDIDKAVKQPLVDAEQKHIQGILDGREEDYDLQTVSIPNAAAANSYVAGNLEVPSGEVWYVNAVRIVLPADQGGSPSANWHCSLWTDRAATPSFYGQPFHAALLNFGPGGGINWDEFTSPANWWAATNKPILLRLPSGTVITLNVRNTGAVATAQMDCTIALFGFIGKALVD